MYLSKFDWISLTESVWLNHDSGFQNINDQTQEQKVEIKQFFQELTHLSDWREPWSTTRTFSGARSARSNASIREIGIRDGSTRISIMESITGWKSNFFESWYFQVTEIVHIVVNSVDNLLDSFFRLLLRRVLILRFNIFYIFWKFYLNL